MNGEFRQPNLLAGVFAGLIAGLVTLTYSVSYAALIFSGPLNSHFSLGVSMAMISATVVAFVVALKSSIPFAIAGPDSNASAILALMCAAIVAQIPANNENEIVSTIIMVLALSTLAVGACQFLLGRLKLGYLVRFIPYPVLGGFLAGTGWLILRGAFNVMMDTTVEFRNITLLLEKGNLVHWLPGVLFAFVLRALLKHFRHFLILPACLLVGIVGTHLCLHMLDMAPAQAWESGWLFKPFDQLPSLMVWAQVSQEHVRWDLIGYQSGNFLAMTGVVIITILLNATGIELATQRDANLDQEMSAAGAANLCTGALGGMIGYLSISRSLLNYKAGGISRMSGMVAAALCACVFLFGSSLLANLPRMVLGGLLFYLGFVLLIEWVIDSWKKLSRLDYALVMIIMLSIASWGFLEGVSLGLLISVVLFVVNYSRINIVKLVLSGANHRSSFVRNLAQEEALKVHGEQVYMLTLQGYLFFGTANNLHEQVRARLANKKECQVKYIVLDFRLVTGQDSSVTLSFIKIQRLAEREGQVLCMTHLSDIAKNHFTQGGLVEGERVRFFPTLDYCVQWCEDRILEAHGAVASEQQKQMREQLAQMFLEPAQAGVFLGYLKRMDIADGDYVVHQGEPAEELFFIEIGHVTAQLEYPGGEKIRLLTMGSGTVFGEMGLYTYEPRSASIKTEGRTSLYVLSRKSLELLEVQHPEIAMRFHRYVIRMLASRISLSNRKVRMLLQ